MSMDKIVTGRVKKIVPEMMVVTYSDGDGEHTVEVDSRKNTVGYLKEGNVVFLNPNAGPDKISVSSNLSDSISDFGLMDKNLFHCEPVEELVVFRDMRLNREDFRKTDCRKIGMKGSDLLVVAGRYRGVLPLNVAYNTAVNEKEPVGIFSLSVSRGELAMYIIRSQEMVPQKELDEFESTHDYKTLQKIIGAYENLREIPIFIDDENRMNVSEVCFRAKRMKDAFGIKLLVIDNLESLDDRRNYQDEGNVIEIMGRLKRLAEELCIPVICMSNLSGNARRGYAEQESLDDSEFFPFHAVLQHADMVALIAERIHLGRRHRRRNSNKYMVSITIAEKMKTENDSPPRV